VLIVFKGLRLNVFIGPITNHFTQHQVFFTGVCNVHGGHLQPRGGAPPFSPFVDVYSVNAETDHDGYAFCDPFAHDGTAEVFRVRLPWRGADVFEAGGLRGEMCLTMRMTLFSLCGFSAQWNEEFALPADQHDANGC
jgi:hypothetical protein